MWLLLLQLCALAESAPLSWTTQSDHEALWWIRTEIALPQPVWFAGERNVQARVVGLQLTGVYRCSPSEHVRGQVHEWTCVIEDFGIVAASMKRDQKDLTPVLEAWDRLLTGAEVELRLHADGRVVGVDLEGVSKRNPREAGVHETMRLMLMRSFAGLDLQLRPRELVVGEAWAQFESQLFLAPSASGTIASSQTAHRIQQVEAGRVVIDSMGKGTISPGMWGAPGASGVRDQEQSRDSVMSLDYYETLLESVTVFDVTKGVMIERVWTATAHPTAGSRAAEGRAGLPYTQRGQLRTVLDGAAWPSVGPTSIVLPDGSLPTSIRGPSLPEVESR